MRLEGLGKLRKFTSSRLEPAIYATACNEITTLIIIIIIIIIIIELFAKYN
jgi:hypothetical protein